MAPKLHHSLALSFSARAALPSCPPLSSYLLSLIAIKRSNLALSADVTTTSELLALAEELGDYICVLKTHADIISDFSDRTVSELQRIAQRKHFLIFEDRKFADIGSRSFSTAILYAQLTVPGTVQKQYAGGPLCIAKWAEIVTIHVFPGPGIVTALKQAANSSISRYNMTVHTEISVGPTSDEDYDLSPTQSAGMHDVAVPHRGRDSDAGLNSAYDPERMPVNRKDPTRQSIVSISTTISTRSEPMSPQPSGSIFATSMQREDTVEDAYERLGPVPHLRASLLLAQMSSASNLLDARVTDQAVAMARANRDFVMGFIAQRSLNVDPDDNFITFTPGVQFADEKAAGDGLGQQYSDPRDLVLKAGTDVIIVGRGILQAQDRAAAAQKYRREAWTAYEARISRRS
jgi:uridine monophosphate synthetase